MDTLNRTVCTVFDVVRSDECKKLSVIRPWESEHRMFNDTNGGLPIERWMMAEVYMLPLGLPMLAVTYINSSANEGV